MFSGEDGKIEYDHASVENIIQNNRVFMQLLQIILLYNCKQMEKWGKNEERTEVWISFFSSTRSDSEINWVETKHVNDNVSRLNMSKLMTDVSPMVRTRFYRGIQLFVFRELLKGKCEVGNANVIVIWVLSPREANGIANKKRKFKYSTGSWFVVKKKKLCWFSKLNISKDERFWRKTLNENFLRQVTSGRRLSHTNGS